MARNSEILIRSFDIGWTRKSLAPLLIALTISSAFSDLLVTIIGRKGFLLWIFSRNLVDWPLTESISRKIRSYWQVLIAS